MTIAEQLQIERDNVAIAKGRRVQFVDCDSGKMRHGTILDYHPPYVWEIQPLRKGTRITYATDVRLEDGSQLTSLPGLRDPQTGHLCKKNRV